MLGLLLVLLIPATAFQPALPPVSPNVGRAHPSSSAVPASWTRRVGGADVFGGQPVQWVSATASTTTELLAKPPPTANFDLDAILAFEEEMAAEERAAKAAAAESGGSAGGGGEDGPDHGPFPRDDGDGVDADVRTHVVPPDLDGARLDAALGALEPDLSRSLCGTLVSDGCVAVLPAGSDVDGGEEGSDDDAAAAAGSVVTRKSHRVSAGDALTVRLVGEEAPAEIVPQDIPLDVIFEDGHVVVLNKAAGMVVHPAAGNWDGTVVNALAHYLARVSSHGPGEFVGSDGRVSAEALGGAAGVDVEGTDGEAALFRPGVVHRLDKGTTGVLVVAKTREALAALSESFAQRKAKKTYVTVTVGNPGKRVVIDRPIGRHPVHRQRMRVVPEPSRRDLVGRRPAPGPKPPSQAGRRALSLVDTLAFDGRLSVVEVRIETGRTHQIRVHLQDRRTPVYGDDVYGLPDWNRRLAKTHSIERPLLHAARLEIDHPVTGERMVLRAPMADDMAKIVDGIWPQGREERPDLYGL